MLISWDSFAFSFPENTNFVREFKIPISIYKYLYSARPAFLTQPECMKYNKKIPRENFVCVKKKMTEAKNAVKFFELDLRGRR